MRYSANPKDWFDDLQEIESERRYSHGEGCREAGESPDYRGRLFVRRGPRGWHYFCHNCGRGGFKQGKYRRGGMEVHLHSEVHSGSGGGGVYPRTSSKAPIPRWLNKYNITDEEISHHGIGYSEDYSRIILPINTFDGRVIGWQGRGDKPKYLTKYLTESKDDRAGSYFHSTPIRDGSGLPRPRSICIVEDILSAIKVARVVESGVALLSSPKHLPEKVCNIIAKNYDKVFIWMDPDKKGASINYSRRLQSLYGMETKIIMTDKDPKEYEVEEMNVYMYESGL